MKIKQVEFTYINGPTVLIEVNRHKLLTDPTFDPAGEEYSNNLYTLKKLSDPALRFEDLGKVDAVLLSHDHHFDNLDRTGRAILPEVKNVVTTEAGAERLGGNSIGISNWQTIELPASNGMVLQITGTPARHGPQDGDRGPVTGFILTSKDDPVNAIYISGDTVWYKDLLEIKKRYNVRIAVLFMGAARVLEVGSSHLTFTADEGIKAAELFQDAVIVPLHYEGWGHFTESRSEINKVFKNAGIDDRLQWLKPGLKQTIHFRTY